MPQPPNRTKPADYHFHVYDYTSAQPWVLSKGEPQRNNSQFYSMVQDLQGLLAYGRAQGVPNIALNDVGVGILGADDWMLRKIKALSFGGPKGDFSKTPSALITGGIHAREWIAPEMAYLLAEYLIRNYSNADPDTLTPYQRNIRQLVDNRRIHIIPLLNPNGNDYTVRSNETNARLWRKNRRSLPNTYKKWFNALTDGAVAHPPFQKVIYSGVATTYQCPRYDGPNWVPPGPPVPATGWIRNTLGPASVGLVGVDINRNFDTDAWGYDGFGATNPKDGDSKPASDSYFGPQRGSEIETKNVMAFLSKLTLGVHMDLHCPGEFILFPTEAADAGLLITQEYRNLGLMLQELTRTANGLYKLGIPRDPLLAGYDATGTLTDYTARRQTHSFAIEMSPASDGFSLPEDKIQTEFERNIRGALALIAMADGGDFRHAVPYASWNVLGRGNRLPE